MGRLGFIRPIAVCAMMAGTVTACSDGDSGLAEPDADSSAPQSQTVLQQALGRVSADALGEQRLVYFAQNQKLTELGDEHQSWKFTAGFGTDLHILQADDGKPLGIDVDASDYSIVVGVPPQTLTLIAGGQDEQAIRDAAEQLGYAGDDILEAKQDVKVIETVSVNKIKPAGDDVALGKLNTDMSWLDGGSGLDDPEVSDIAGCLGDVLAAQLGVPPGQQDAGGVGISADGATVVSVLCVPGDQSRADDLQEAFTSEPQLDRFSDVQAEAVDGMVKVTTTHEAADGPATQLITMFIKGLPA